MKIFLICVGVYLAIGILVTLVLSQTPYADNGWLRMTALWPLFVWAFVAN